jgi:hypothetical protein
VFTSLARAFLLTLSLLAVAVASGAEPPAYTAFPDLKPRPFGPDDPNLIPVLPPLPADASPLRKVQHAQATDGLRYVARITEIMRLGNWDNRFLFDTVLLANEVYAVAAACEDTLTNHVPWYEERVRTLKQIERLLEHRAQVSSGTPNPLRFHFVRFHRLQAEYDLLILTDVVAKTGGGTPRPLTMKKAKDTVFNPEQLPQIDTAFPDLKPQMDERKAIPLPRLPLLPASASTLRKVRQEQVLEGFSYLQVSRPVAAPLQDFGPPDFQFLYYFRNTTDTYRLAAELEERGADRVPWYEARVRLFKLAEQLTLQRVLNGTEPPQKLDAIRFYRFQAEAELLRLKAEVDKASPTTSPAPERAKFAIEELWGLYDVKQRFYYSAFPDLNPRTVEKIEVKGFEGKPDFEFRDKDVVPLPALPTASAKTPLTQKVRLEQVREGLAYLDRIRKVILNGTWTSQFFPEYLRMTTETFRVAAELESTLAKRILWYEARVRTFKDIERFIHIRVQNGMDPQERIHDVRVQRLGAEAELLALKDEAARPAPAPVVIVVCPTPCPPVCSRPRGRLLPRLFHRR